MRFQPIEETLIIPTEYSEFATIFPSIYRKISERLNDHAVLERMTAYVDTNPKTIYSHVNENLQTFIYMVFGDSATQPGAVGVCTIFADGTGIVLPLATHTPGNDTLSVQLNRRDLQLSLSSGAGLFEIKPLFL